MPPLRRGARISFREAYITLAVQDSIPPGVLPRLPKRFIPRKPTKRIHASGEQRDDGLINMRYPMGDLSGSRRDAGDPGIRSRGLSASAVMGYRPRARSTLFRLGPDFFTARFTLAFDLPVFFASYRTS